MFFICTRVGLAGALVFLVLGSGVEQEWARDPNMNIDFDVYTIDERKQSIDQPQPSGEEMDWTTENDKNDGMNSVSENQIVKVEYGHVDDGFVEQVNKIEKYSEASHVILTHHF